MEQTNQTPQTEMSSQSLNVSQTLNEGGALLDAASMAAKTIADASGLTSLEAIATMVMSLHSRLMALEQAAPVLQQAADAATNLVASIPDGFIERVEGFFGRHFPSHAAPVAPAADAAKSE